ncbi:hypothetical protein VTG60DRAFT_4991 [Thermothelomyces hinnuleus]
MGRSAERSFWGRYSKLAGTFRTYASARMRTLARTLLKLLCLCARGHTALAAALRAESLQVYIYTSSPRHSPCPQYGILRVQVTRYSVPLHKQDCSFAAAKIHWRIPCLCPASRLPPSPFPFAVLALRNRGVDQPTTGRRSPISDSQKITPCEGRERMIHTSVIILHHLP